MDYGAHLAVIDFGFHKFSLEWLSEYVRTARDVGFKAISTNDHLISSRPWLDAPTALALRLCGKSRLSLVLVETRPALGYSKARTIVWSVLSFNNNNR